jgi:hypothetical protein
MLLRVLQRELQRVLPSDAMIIKGKQHPFVGMELECETTQETKDDFHSLSLILGLAPTSTSSWFI